MKSWARLSRALCLGFVVSTATTVSADTLRTKDGQERQGKALSTDGAGVRFKAVLGKGSATLTIPVEKIERLTIEFTPDEEDLMSTADPEDLAPLADLWNRRKAYLSIPGTQTPKIGRALSRVLLASEDEAKAEKALQLAQYLEKRDLQNRSAYADLRLKALLQLGRTEEAIALADELAATSGTAAENIAEAKFFLAEAAVGKMRVLEKEYPRWFEMPEKMDERRELYHSALDAYLYPVVFTPLEEQDVARGLWKAAELYHAVGFPVEALKCLQEIIDSYSVPEYLQQAQQLASQIKRFSKDTINVQP